MAFIMKMIHKRPSFINLLQFGTGWYDDTNVRFHGVKIHYLTRSGLVIQDIVALTNKATCNEEMDAINSKKATSLSVTKHCCIAAVKQIVELMKESVNE